MQDLFILYVNKSCILDCVYIYGHVKLFVCTVFVVYSVFIYKFRKLYGAEVFVGKLIIIAPEL